MTAEHMASCQNKRPCAPEQQKQDSPHRDRDKDWLMLPVSFTKLVKFISESV